MITPFKRHAPEDVFSPSGRGDYSMFQWWPWPIGAYSPGFGLDYPSDGILPPRDVLDWLSVAEWRFQIELDGGFGNTAQSIDQIIKPGSRYVQTYDMGASETQGRESTSMLGNMQIGSLRTPEPYMAGIEMSWREVIEDLRYTYGFNINLRFPGYAFDGTDHFWGVNPECSFSIEVSNPDGSSPTSSSYQYVNFLGDDYNGSLIPSPPSSFVTLAQVTIHSTF